MSNPDTLGRMSLHTPAPVRRPSWVIPVIVALVVLLVAAVATVVVLLMGDDDTPPGGAPVDGRVIEACRMLEAAAGSQDPARYKAVAMIAKDAADEDISRQGARLDRTADFASFGTGGEGAVREMLAAADELDKTCDDRGY